MKKLQVLLLSFCFLALSTNLTACNQAEQVEESQLQVDLSEATVAVEKEAELTYGIKEQVEYDAPKVIQFDPLTGEKKTLYTPPEKPEDYTPPTMDEQALNEDIVRQTLPNVPINPHLKANLAGFWPNAKATMFDAVQTSLSSEESKAFKALETFLLANDLQSSSYLGNFTMLSDIDNDWLLERLFWEASNKLSNTQVSFDAMLKLAQKYLGKAATLSGSNTPLLKYDVKEQLFSLKDKTKFAAANFRGQTLIDPQITANGSDYYISGHEIVYRNLRDFISKAHKDQVPDAGIITCGDWIVGYYDNRFSETAIANGGIIFAEYNWLDAKYYLMKYDATSQTYFVAQKGAELGTENKQNYKARPASPQALKDVNFIFSKFKLKIGEEYLAAALPITARYSEQVISRFTKDEEVFCLNLPFNDMYLVFSTLKEAKRPAFVKSTALS